MATSITIQEIFAMRKNGQFEQAYEAVLPMYREHHGHYTTLCMFWTATDVMRLRIEAGRCAEAEQIFAALRNLYPNLQDRDHSAGRTLNRLALSLATEEQERKRIQTYRSSQEQHAAEDGKLAWEAEPMSFSILNYMLETGLRFLDEEDWQSQEFNGHPVPSLAMKLISRIFHEVNDDKECASERLEDALSLVELALGRLPKSRHLLRYQAALLARTGRKDKAIAIYRQLTQRSREAYLFSELAALIDTPTEQVALLAQAILYQRTAAFAQKDRLTFASLIREYYPQHAAYELQQIISFRESLGQHLNRSILQLQQQLADITPVSQADQQEFYQRLIAKAKQAA